MQPMRSCYQTKGMNILEHGQSVHSFYEDLCEHLFNDAPLKHEWKLPEWLINNVNYISHKLLPFDIMKEYQIFHDCGKPFCLTIDEDGKRHFVNHANASYNRWNECTTTSDRNVQIGELIKSDMDIHLLSGDGLQAFSERPEAISLLITGLCEIHSNASMFGGIESTSFKIKWKHINKRGKGLLSILTKE
jgi:hypothetical protein